MTQTTYTDNVKIDGSQDIAQLDVEANSTQTEALQQWSENGGDPLARVTGDGRLQVGSFAAGAMATDDALIEAHRDETDTSKPTRGLHLLGEITGTLSSIILWAVKELVLKGSGGISALHSALRVKVTNENTGAMSAGAELRAGDFEVVNDGGTVSNATDTRAVGVHAAVTNNTGSFLDTAIGVDVELADNGTLTNAYGIRVADVDQGSGDNYAIKTGKGIAHFGDHIELPILSSDPTDDPATDDLKLYPKLDGSLPQLYAKDDAGDVHRLNSYPKRARVMVDEFTVVSGASLVVDDHNSQKYNVICWQSSAAQDDSLSISVFLDAGTYTFYTLGWTGPNYGKIKWYLDSTSGSHFADFNYYSASIAHNVIHSDTVTIDEPGYHSIIGEVYDNDSLSTDFYYVLTMIWLKPSSD